MNECEETYERIKKQYNLPNLDLTNEEIGRLGEDFYQARFNLGEELKTLANLLFKNGLTEAQFERLIDYTESKIKSNPTRN
jgi:hypothetical protein